MIEAKKTRKIGAADERVPTTKCRYRGFELPLNLISVLYTSIHTYDLFVKVTLESISHLW